MGCDLIQIGFEYLRCRFRVFCGNLIPVSYTHLDVYKRQVLSRFIRVCSICSPTLFCSHAALKAFAIAPTMPRMV